MKKFFTLAVMALLSLTVQAQDRKTWDFTKDISDESNKMKILICTIVIEAIAIFVIEIVIGTGMLVPLRNIIGFIVLIVTYIISNHVFLKRI